MTTRVFLVGDLHFSHRNIITYCNRPWDNTEDMNRDLIKWYNEVVGADDLVINLGDIAMASKERTAHFLSQLNGHKILIRGNHDNFTDQWYRDHGFEYVSKYPILMGKFFWMSHAPIEAMHMAPGPFFNCYAHLHDSPMAEITESSKCFSVERIGYRPVHCFDIVQGDWRPVYESFR